MSQLTRCYRSTTLDTRTRIEQERKKKLECHFLVSKDWEKIGRANIEDFKKDYNSFMKFVCFFLSACSSQSLL